MLSVFSKMCNSGFVLFFFFILNTYESKAQPKHLHAMATQTAQREEKVNNATRKIIGREK